MTGRAAVLGLGARGVRWVETCLAAGWDVRGFDPDDRTATEINGGPAWRRETTISAAVGGADMIFCCLPDRIELLRPVLQRAQASASPQTVLAVVGDAFDMDELQSCAIRSTNIVKVGEGAEGDLSIDLSRTADSETRERVKEAMSVLAAAFGVTAFALPKETELSRDRREA